MSESGTLSAESNVASPPYRLETLGTLALRGFDSAKGAGDQRQQRRRLALLAVLAGSEKLGRSRDQLLLLFWPDSTERKARHSLDQLLYAMRTSLGESVFSGVNPLRLNPAIITSDLVDFERHFDGRNFAAAVELYRGPFLDGFYLNDAKEFEDWADAKRRSLATRYADALENLALEAEQRHDYPAVVRWRQKLVDADRVSSRHAMALASALAKAGDYAAAVAFADRYERSATRELGAGNVPDIKKVVREIGDRSSLPPKLGAGSVPDGGSTPLPSPPGMIAHAPTTSSANQRVFAPRSLATWTLAAVAVLVIMGIGALRYFPRASANAAIRDEKPEFSAARRGTRSIQAYELYVRGHDPLLLRNDSAAKVGLGYFIQATQIDSNFAAGYAGLAEMYARQAMGSSPSLPRAVLRDSAEIAARKAILLDDSLAEGHAALGMVDSYWLVDLNAAEKELQRAVALDSSVPHALEYLALNDALLGKRTDALEDARKAVARDPLSPTATATYAQILYVSGRCGEALPILDSLSVLKPPPLRVAIARSLCYDDQRRWSDAQTAVRRQAAKGEVHALAMLGLALGLSGERKEALEIRSRVRTISQANPSIYYDLAIISYGLGDTDDAFANLDRAMSSGVFTYEILGPVFASLRADPRFKTIAGSRGIALASNR